MIAALIGILVASFVGVMLLMVVGTIFGVVFGLLGMAFKLLPIVLVGWVVVKLVQAAERRRGLPSVSSADQRWLDT